MCGIAGIVSSDRLDADAPARALAMRDVITHRGPDEAGLHVDDHAALAHRRLSIVDLSTGQQPLSNEDGTVWVVFNGEIYNHIDVRRELEACGHRYKTKSDTETVVHAYEEWGDDCVHRFRGMFAFAIWNAPRRRLLLVRDRLGIKPLYWTRVGDRVLFGSEIKAILASDLVEPQANTAVLPEVLSTRYVSGSRHDVQRHSQALAGASSRLRAWRPLRAAVLGRPHRALCEGKHRRIRQPPRRRLAVPDLLAESVKLRLMSDVPLGMFLSGGIDSSAIAALMAGMIDRPVQTFSVAFEDRAFNELEYARDVARVIKADAHEIVIDDEDFFGALPKLLWHEDEPIAHTSSVPLYFVSALARQHVTVVLTGEGSDELLAGYGKYPRVAWNWRAGTIYERMLPRSVRDSIARRVPMLPRTLGRYASRSFLTMDRTAEAMFFDNFASIRLADQRKLLAPAAILATQLTFTPGQTTKTVTVAGQRRHDVRARTRPSPSTCPARCNATICQRPRAPARSSTTTPRPVAQHRRRVSRPRATAAPRSCTFTVSLSQRQRQHRHGQLRDRRRHRHQPAATTSPTSGTLTFAPGQTTPDRHRPRQRRHQFEADETFSVTSPAPATPRSPAPATAPARSPTTTPRRCSASTNVSQARATAARRRHLHRSALPAARP